MTTILWNVNDKTYGLVVKNGHREANRLNKYLQRYEDVIQEGDEPIFFFEKKKLATVQIILKKNLRISEDLKNE